MSAKVPDKKIAAVIIAYNAAKTIEATWNEIPKDWVDLVIIGDDCSRDNTAELARGLPGALVIRHEKNQHMGGNQMILFDKALEMGFDIIVLFHGDNQFDPGKVPEMVRAITEGGADAVLGSRIAGRQAREGGMPRYKEISNKVLSFVQNTAYRLNLSDYATGYKAYTRKVLETIPYRRNRRDFLFDEHHIINED
ncbi:MAG: glycosyltransferase family 2 protein, partial [Verrucomicrobia bacterium]|nr:glycosyltransferase family 2 protein [Verrucomicrobiota bacterium]